MWNVTASSCVIARTMLRALAVLELEHLVEVGQRPVLLPQLRGWMRTGMSSSWPPIASISSRMTAAIFWMTRQPAGR